MELTKDKISLSHIPAASKWFLQNTLSGESNMLAKLSRSTGADESLTLEDAMQMTKE